MPGPINELSRSPVSSNLSQSVDNAALSSKALNTESHISSAATSQSESWIVELCGSIGRFFVYVFRCLFCCPKTPDEAPAPHLQGQLSQKTQSTPPQDGNLSSSAQGEPLVVTPLIPQAQPKPQPVEQQPSAATTKPGSQAPVSLPSVSKQGEPLVVTAPTPQVQSNPQPVEQQLPAEMAQPASQAPPTRRQIRQQPIAEDTPRHLIKREQVNTGAVVELPDVPQSPIAMTLRPAHRTSLVAPQVSCLITEYIESLEKTLAEMDEQATLAQILQQVKTTETPCKSKETAEACIKAITPAPDRIAPSENENALRWVLAQLAELKQQHSAHPLPPQGHSSSSMQTSDTAVQALMLTPVTPATPALPDAPVAPSALGNSPLTSDERGPLPIRRAIRFNEEA